MLFHECAMGDKNSVDSKCIENLGTALTVFLFRARLYEWPL